MDKLLKKLTLFKQIFGLVEDEAKEVEVVRSETESLGALKLAEA